MSKKSTKFTPPSPLALPGFMFTRKAKSPPAVPSPEGNVSPVGALMPAGLVHSPSNATPVRDRTPEVESILSIVGNLRDEHVKTVGDDGISQSVAVRTGISSVEDVAIPNPVTLQPYRTFLEVEQPESEFIFRMQRGHEGQLPVCGLFEADAGAWELKAITNIRDWLGQRIKDVKIIA